MDARTATRFKLFDALVLIAATATGLALGRAVTAEELATRSDAVAFYAISVAYLWTLAVLGLSLTRYREPRRELACRPGFSAGVAIVIERLADALYYAVVIARENPFFPSLTLSTFPACAQQLLCMSVADVVVSSSCAGVVAAVWLVTAIAGCWHPEKTWIDRTGRALGIFWLVVTVAYRLSVWAFPAPVANTPPGFPY